MRILRRLLPRAISRCLEYVGTRPTIHSPSSRFPSLRVYATNTHTHLALSALECARPPTGERPRAAAASLLVTLARLSTRSGAPAHDIRRRSACLSCLLLPARSNLSSTGLVCLLCCLVRLISSLHPSLRCRACKHHCLLNSRPLLPPPQRLRLGFIKLPPCSFFNLALTTAHCCIPFVQSCRATRNISQPSFPTAL